MKVVRLGPEPGPWVQRVADLEAQAFGAGGLNAWSLVPLGRHGRVFGCVEGEEMIAAAQVFRDWERPELAYLVGISVDDRFRGRGFGTQFLKAIHNQLALEGIGSLELTVDPRNVAAIRVYRDKLGYRVVDQRPAEYGPGEDRWSMVVGL